MAKIFRRPYILHLHGAEFSEFYQRESGRVQQRIIEATFRHAGLVIALSNKWRDEVLRICAEARVEVIPNAVPLPNVKDKAEKRTDPQGAEILFLGQLGKRKGTFDLMHAFSRLAPVFPMSTLVCAGDGDKEVFKELSVKLGVENRVEFPGWLDPELCREHLRRAYMFVLPSYAEGLPMSVLEAMSWEVPVVSCPVGGIPELIQSGENGFLVDAGDIDGLTETMRTLLNDSDLHARMARDARATIERGYSLEAQKERLGQIYASFGLYSVKGEKGEA